MIVNEGGQKSNALFMYAQVNQGAVNNKFDAGCFVRMNLAPIILWIHHECRAEFLAVNESDLMSKAVAQYLFLEM